MTEAKKAAEKLEAAIDTFNTEILKPRNDDEIDPPFPCIEDHIQSAIDADGAEKDRRIKELEEGLGSFAKIFEEWSKLNKPHLMEILSEIDFDKRLEMFRRAAKLKGE